MTVSQEQINDLYSADVVTPDDENLGGVGQVYLDDHTGEPSWVSVKTGWFGTNQSLVPLAGAELIGDGKVRVAHTKETIKDAPNVDADAHLSSDAQDELFRYYAGAGVDVSRYGDRTVPEDTVPESAVREDGDRVGTGPGEDPRAEQDAEREAAVADVLGHQGVHSKERVGLRRHVDQRDGRGN